MKILVNASALNSAGGRSIGLNFYKGISNSSEITNYHFFFFFPEKCGYEEEVNNDDKNIKVFFVKANMLKWYNRYNLEYFLSKHINLLEPNVIFSMGNIAIRNKKLNQVLLIHWPYLVYPESEVWRRMSYVDKLKRLIRKRITIKRLKYVDKILFQTNTMLERFIYNHGKKHNGEYKIVPNAVSLPSKSKPIDSIFKEKTDKKVKGKKVFLCLTRYYEHKNLEIFIQIGKILKKKKENFCIVLTIDAKHGNGAKKLLHEIKKYELQDYLINIGEVDFNLVPMLYNLSFAVILPTLLESYSGIYIESMYYDKPILTSNLDFAKEICKDQAIYFDPNNELEITQKMSSLVNEESNIVNRFNYKEILKSSKDWNQITSLIIKELISVDK